MAETGLPGSPKNGTPPTDQTPVACLASFALAKNAGRPRAHHAFYQVICADRDARRNDEQVSFSRQPFSQPGAQIAGRVAGNAELNRQTTVAHHLRCRAQAIALRICPGRIGSPGCTNSSPVASTATRGGESLALLPAQRRQQRDLGWANHRARTERPVPLRTSPPASECAPLVLDLCRTLTWAGNSPLCTGSSVASIGTTASAPAGNGAPVMIRAA